MFVTALPPPRLFAQATLEVVRSLPEAAAALDALTASRAPARADVAAGAGRARDVLAASLGAADPAAACAAWANAEALARSGQHVAAGGALRGLAATLRAAGDRDAASAAEASAAAAFLLDGTLDFAAAEAAAEAAMDDAESSRLMARQTMCRALTAAGLSELAAGRPEDAEGHLQNAARLAPDGAPAAAAMGNLGSALYLAGTADGAAEACETWREALDLAEADADAGDADTDATAGLRAALLCNVAEATLAGADRAACEGLVENELDAAVKLLDGSRSGLAYARTLALLGRCHHKTEQAVTAEGLFRASADAYAAARGELVGCAAAGAARGAADAQRMQGELLLDWEKREAAGQALVDAAAAGQCGLSQLLFLSPLPEAEYDDP